MPQFHTTVVAPINIAFIKYWGKRESGEQLILPTNDSFSITLATEPFRSKTTVVLSDKIAEDELRRFAQLLRCLPGPPRTLVVIRAPLYAGAGPPCRSPTPELLSATRDAVRRLHAEGVFGPALLLDGYSLGHSLLTNATREPPPSDWASPYGGGRDIVNRKHGWPPWHAAHVPPYRYNTAHYTAAFQDAQWQLLLEAWCAVSAHDPSRSRSIYRSEIAS